MEKSQNVSRTIVLLFWLGFPIFQQLLKEPEAFIYIAEHVTSDRLYSLPLATTLLSGTSIDRLKVTKPLKL